MRVALGFRTHSGWTAMVALRDPAAAPAVVQRRRLELADLRISGSKQPYHAAEKMTLNEAEEFIRERAESSLAMARNGVDKALADSRRRVMRCTVLAWSPPQAGRRRASLPL